MKQDMAKRTNYSYMHIQRQISHIYWKKSAGTKKYLLYDAIYRKFKNRQNLSMVTETKTMVDYERG